MTRSLLPPRGIFVPTGLIYDPKLPAAVRETWIQLRGLAWGRLETPSLTLAQISTILDKTQSTLYGHMRLLHSRGALRWRTGGKSKIIVVFPQDGELNDSGFPEKPDPLPLPDSSPVFKHESDLHFPNAVDQLNAEGRDSAVRDSGFPENEQSRGQPAPQAALDAIAGALAEVTGMHAGLNAPRLARTARRLLEAGYSAGQVAQLYGQGRSAGSSAGCSGQKSAWYARDWRGRKGEPPTPGEIEQTIAVLSAPAPLSSNQEILRRSAEKEGIDFDDL